MGQSHSGPYLDLIRARNSQEWKTVDHLQDCELWLNCSTLEKYMAYPLNWEDADSHYNLEIYHFRKLNRQYLVAPQFILKNSQDMCSEQGSLHLLLENIPARLGEINRHLSFQDRLLILASTYSALHTLSYVYGPLLISENQICFDEAGRVKVWVNEILCFNEPPEPKNILQEEGTPSSVFMLHCVTEVLRTVGNRQIFTYPQDFRELILKATTFAEGEQLVNDYCLLKGIALAQTISFWNYKQHPKEFLFHSSKKDSLSCSLLAIDQSRPPSLFSDSSVLPSLKDQSFVAFHPKAASFVRSQNNPPTKIIINVGKKEIKRNGDIAIIDQKEVNRRSQQAEPFPKKTQIEHREQVRESPRIKIVFNRTEAKNFHNQNENRQTHSGNKQLFEIGIAKKIDTEKSISKPTQETPSRKLNSQSKTKDLPSIAQNFESHEQKMYQKIEKQQQNFIGETKNKTELKDQEEYHEQNKELFQENKKQNQSCIVVKEQISSLENRSELKDTKDGVQIEEEQSVKQISLKQLFSNFRRQTEKNISTLQQIEASQQTSYETIKNTTFGKIQIEPELAYQQYVQSLNGERSFQKSVGKSQQRKCKREEKLEERYNKYVKGRHLKADTYNRSTGAPLSYLQDQSSSLTKRYPEKRFQKLKEEQLPSYQKH